MKVSDCRASAQSKATLQKMMVEISWDLVLICKSELLFSRTLQIKVRHLYFYDCFFLPFLDWYNLVFHIHLWHLVLIRKRTCYNNDCFWGVFSNPLQEGEWKFLVFLAVLLWIHQQLANVYKLGTSVHAGELTWIRLIYGKLESTYTCSLHFSLLFSFYYYRQTVHVQSVHAGGQCAGVLLVWFPTCKCSRKLRVDHRFSGLGWIALVCQSLTKY